MRVQVPETKQASQGISNSFLPESGHDHPCLPSTGFLLGTWATSLVEKWLQLLQGAIHYADPMTHNRQTPGALLLTSAGHHVGTVPKRLLGSPGAGESGWEGAHPSRGCGQVQAEVGEGGCRGLGPP